MSEIVLFIYLVLLHEKEFEKQLQLGESIFLFSSEFCEKVLQDTVELDPTDMQDYLVSIMQLIRIFSRTDELAVRMGDLGALDLIIQSMTKMPYSTRLQINCSACLANLASVEQNRAKMIEMGCMKLVLDNLSRFIRNPNVLAEICATLANLACHKISSEYLVNHGGCDLIIKAMRLHSDQIDFQIQAFHAISGIGKPSRLVLEREEFLDLAIKTFQTNKESVELISAGWHALGSLANSSGLSLMNKKDILLNLLFASMRRFEDNPTFQITACFALSHMFFNNREEHVDENLITKYKGVSLILRFMEKYSDQESLQTTALFALGSIVMKSNQHRETLYECKGIESIIRAMKRQYSKDKNKIQTGAPEPVLYSRGTSKIQCSKPLLLQLFGSVCLLNLSETRNIGSCSEM
jgi:hypothetical protein